MASAIYSACYNSNARSRESKDGEKRDQKRVEETEMAIH